MTTKGIIVSRKEIVTTALNTLWKSSKDNSIILLTVANEVLVEINSLEFDNINYPSPENFLENIDCFVITADYKRLKENESERYT